MTPITPPVPRGLLRRVGRAIGDYEMIRSGDRLLLGLSGGKDSLTLLHALIELRDKSRTPFSLGACTVDPCIDGYDPSSLRSYVPTLGIPHFYVRQAIVERALKTMRGTSFCAYCARVRRGILYETARREGYNVLVLGQHLDDLAESFLMSAFYGGRLKTMKAHYRNDAGDVRVIRPLVYVRERETRAYAERAGIPVVLDNCPACFRVPTQRARFKGLLSDQERLHNKLFPSLLSAMRPLMNGYSPENE